MKPFDGERIGVWSLRLDALYCAIVGVAVALWAQPLSVLMELPPGVLVVAGCAVVAWAGLVAWMVTRVKLRVALRLVMVVNIFAAMLVAAISSVAASTLVVLAILAIALDVALFAASQAVALRRIAVHREA